jgi:hypothetical protein
MSLLFNLVKIKLGIFVAMPLTILGGIVLFQTPALAQAKFYQVKDANNPGIVVIDAERANLTERSLLGIKTIRHVSLSNKCGEISFNWNQYNINREVNLVLNNGNSRLINIQSLPNTNDVAKSVIGCYTSDSVNLGRVIVSGLIPNSPQVVEERVKNYRDIRYNNCGISYINLNNISSWEEKGTLYFEVAEAKPVTLAALSSLFVGSYISKPVCYKEQIYIPVMEAQK